VLDTISLICPTGNFCIAARHCEGSEAIHSREERMDCFVATLLAMTGSAQDDLRVVIPGRAYLARARNPYSRSGLWIPGSPLRVALRCAIAHRGMTESGEPASPPAPPANIRLRTKSSARRCRRSRCRPGVRMFATRSPSARRCSRSAPQRRRRRGRRHAATCRSRSSSY
jgi:hypothetical protein